MSFQDQRLDNLQLWLNQQLPELFAVRRWPEPIQGSLKPASADASFRRYFRWESAGRTLIVMDAPPPQENCQPFVQIAQLLATAGIHVPEVLAADLEQGFLLLSDLGRQTYLDVINPDNADALFQDAIAALLAFQRLPIEHLSLPTYDDALLDRELQLFPVWYVERHLGLKFSAQQQADWEAICQVLKASALAQPQVLVHRDYMPRNLMLSQPNPGVLDFQDAVLGPITYDITSLFKDAFLSWPEERVRGWLEGYWRQAQEAGLPVPEDFERFYCASDLMGAQRHLKVIGIFARICHRDGKPHYLTDVPRFFAYLRSVLARRPELSPLGQLLDSLPLEPHA
ncbi:hypothetical protein LX59_02380 [Azomonas agilis]|uniref:Aminoglycoside phosphotransferase domain-containing protein n=1 Tax=Azomonas agilis TaxID=116849 RepID=A0A562I0E7_9GAMM|nr:phosphotransferase [Azomonas agilis]TWH64432.1 hypothetical protein LX59_02380 [Azomonas agilis]